MSSKAIRALWGLTPEPMQITALMALGWGIILTSGVVTYVSPPETIRGEIGSTLTALWSLLLLLGGLTGIAGALSGWWWIERVAIVLACTGASVYLGVVLVLHWLTPGNRLTQAGFIAFAVVMLTMRWIRVSGAQLDPTRRKGGP